MKKNTLANMLESVSLKDLKSMIPFKVKLDTLQKNKKDLEKSLETVNQEIESLIGSTGKTARRRTGRPKGIAKKKTVKRTRKRIVRPSLSSVMVELLKEKKKPLKVNEIHDAVLKEKKYITQAKNFKAQVRILLYKNDKGLFKKIKPGVFGLTAEKKPSTKKKAQVPAEKTVKSTKKKAPAPKKKSVKKAAKKKPVQKKKAVPQKAAQKIVQPPLSLLITDILKEKRKTLSRQEIVGALLKEKKYKSTSKNFSELIRKLLYKNPRGLWKKAGEGKFGSM